MELLGQVIHFLELLGEQNIALLLSRKVVPIYIPLSSMRLRYVFASIVIILKYFEVFKMLT